MSSNTIYAYQNRGLTKDIQILSGAGTVITAQANDKIRIAIGHDGDFEGDFSDCKLVVTSDASTGNGSSISKNSPESGKNRVRLDASDLSFEPGMYTFSISYFDNADASEWKEVSRYPFYLEES